MQEIISAISTASGTGGVAIIRISGDDCLSLAKKMFLNRIKNMFKSNLNNLRKTLWITYITGTRSIIEMALWM